MSRPAVFLDRDGTIIVDGKYLADPAGVIPLPGALESLAMLQQHGYLLVIISNQSGIGRGYFCVAERDAVQAHVEELFQAAGVSFAGDYYCPHAPEDDCSCRKPYPTMLLDAARELDIDLAASFMVGDKVSDVQAGHNAGCRALLLAAAPVDCAADFIAPDIKAAAEWIIAQGGKPDVR
ncbi:MAG: HAD family hydrolase [bacterium]